MALSDDCILVALPFHGIGIAWGTMLLTSLMFPPRIEYLTQSFADVPVGTLVFLTCALSIGSVGEATGMSQWIADTALPSFFTKRYSVNRHFYISNIIGHPYFDRISAGHRCRYFSHTDIVRRCSGIGRKRCGRCSDRIPNDCQPVFFFDASGTDCLWHGACWVRRKDRNEAWRSHDLPCACSAGTRDWLAFFLQTFCRIAPRRTSVNNWIVDLNQKEQARGTALVFVPHAGGGPNAFRSVAREIRRKLPVYAICYPGHEK